VTARMAREIAKVLASPATKTRYESLGAEPAGLDNADFKNLLVNEAKQLSTLIRDSKINLE
jgi:tripartite-type tricarboxylate transporter receptor subunit TctC